MLHLNSLQKPNLHSTVVLLKEPIPGKITGITTPFTFYCSSIKRLAEYSRITRGRPFTFYCSSIKR